MPRVLHLEDKTTITIDSEPFGSGGSGDVFRILSPSHLSNQVVKLYHNERLTNDAENKIRHLVSTRISQREHESIVWIKNVVLDDGKFVGFTMNYADGIGLEQFLNDRWWRKNDTKDWDKFELENVKGMENRISLCLNISIAINIIHKNNNYTIADIKPSNFKIHKNGLVSIIDIDNIEVIENGKVVYAAQVITPDFSPPEFHNGLDYKQTAASQNWDRYSLAILFYNILCGIHPFLGVGCSFPFEVCTDCPDLIKNGLFLHGRNSSYINFKQPQHSNFLNLTNEIKSLFIQCFDNGHDKPQLRPSAEDWCRALSYKTSAIKRSSVAELINTDKNYNAKLKNALQFNVFCSPLTLKTDDEFLTPEIKFHSLSNTLSYFDKIINVFTKSQKQILIDELKEIEIGITGMINKQPDVKNDISNIFLEFEGNQHEIKSNEKTQIENLKKSLQLVLNNAEYLATKACGEESEEISELQIRINTLIQKEDLALANYHSLIYANLIKNFDQKRVSYNTALHNFDNERKKEIETLINSPNKLTQYNLERECIKIFHGNLPSIILALKQLNFITAADFSKVYRDGYLLDRSDKIIKIPGMGSERAKKIHNWRIKIEESENYKITNDATIKYSNFKNEISLRWNSFESSYNQAITPLNARFKSREVEINRNKNRLIVTKEAEVNKIKQKFDKLHIDLKNEVITALNRFYIDIEMRQRQTINALQKNLEIHRSQLKPKITEIQESSQWINSELKRYNLLYSKLSIR
ncbi:MAG: hypothetical protein ABI267_02235 [Ginsengibacter sp.]